MITITVGNRRECSKNCTATGKLHEAKPSDNTKPVRGEETKEVNPYYCTGSLEIARNSNITFTS